jgi:hypothetical protein
VYPDEWPQLRADLQLHPNVLASQGIHSGEWSFDFEFATVEFRHNPRLAPDVDRLERESIQESRLMAIHTVISKGLRNHSLSKDRLRVLKKPFKIGKYELTIEAMAQNPTLDPKAIVQFWEDKKSGYYLQLVETVKYMHTIILNTFYTTPIFNVLDAHYLFTLLDQIDEYYVKTVSALVAAIQDPSNDHKPKDIRGDVEKMRQELKIWKNNKFMPDEEYIEKKKVIYRSRWQQHKKKQYEKRIAKRAGLKRQEALKRKADLIKGRDRDVFAINV